MRFIEKRQRPCTAGTIVLWLGTLFVSAAPAAEPDVDEIEQPAEAHHPSPPAGKEMASATKGSLAGFEQSVRVARTMAEFKREPNFETLKNAALRLADADREGAAGLMRRVQLTAVLPVVKVTVGSAFERDESLDRNGIAPDRWGADTDRDVKIQLTAQWQLSELVFNSDSIRVYATLAARADDRQALITLLAGYVFERRKWILLSATVAEADIRKAIETKMRIEELTAIIDALTGGVLSRTLNRTDE